MKRLLLFMLLAVISIAQVSAQARRSIIRVRLSDDSRLAVSLNDRYYDKQGRSITIGDLPAGRHFIKIYRYTPYTNGRGGKARVIYSGGIRISAGTITDMEYDVRNNQLYTQVEFIDDTYDDRRDDRWDDRRDDRWDDRRDDRRDDRDDVYDRHRNSRSWTQQDMNDLKRRVDERIGDSDKQKLIQNVLQDRRYTTEQMRSILSWLSFESTKLEVAKWGYDNVIDKRDYWKLESEFSFNSSKDEFNNYINGRRQ